MKRWFTLLLVLTLGIGLAACGEAKDAMALDSFRNEETGVTISLGMSREEVENILGEGTFFEDYQPVFDNIPDATYNYGDEKDFIRITYRNDHVAGIWKDLVRVTYEDDSTISLWTSADTGLSNWCLKYGLTRGDPITEVFSKYGESKKISIGTTDQGEELYLLAYHYDASGKRVEDDSSAIYTIVFIMEASKDSILSFAIGAV